MLPSSVNCHISSCHLAGSGQTVNMATTLGRMKKNTDENISLHDLFQIIGNQMTTRDIRVLKFLYTGILSDELKDKINDGYTFCWPLKKLEKWMNPILSTYCTL